MRYFLVLFILCFLNCSSEEVVAQDSPKTAIETLYYPPNTNSTWNTKTPESLNWNTNAIDDLYSFLETKNTKGFIVLHQGKIVLEQYFNGHNQNSNWYWASAGKTLTATMLGIAQDQNSLNINNKVSDYIGNAWTSTTSAQEDLITVKNLLSMTSGLDDTLGNDISPNQLQYTANAGSRWAYHNVYLKLQDVVESATNESWTDYFNTHLKNKIGMNGAWVTSNNLNVYWSNTRSMARYGLLISRNGLWKNEQIISSIFLNEATNTSQNINPAYGYLWWLNGKQNYRLPGTQNEFQGKLVPNAPDNMYCALGKNDQKIYIIPSKYLVIIRMGQAGNAQSNAVSSFDNDLWEQLNLVFD